MSMRCPRGRKAAAEAAPHRVLAAEVLRAVRHQSARGGGRERLLLHLPAAAELAGAGAAAPAAHVAASTRGGHRHAAGDYGGQSR